MADRKKLLFDAGLILFFLLAALALYLGLAAGRESGGWAVVRVDGEVTGRYSLSENGTYPLNGGSNPTLVSVEYHAAYRKGILCPAAHARSCALPNRAVVYQIHAAGRGGRI